MHDAAEIERAVAAFARASTGGQVVTASAPAIRHRELIVALAARHKLPAVYYERYFVAGGGLISYGPDFVDQFRRAAGYVDRILRGEKPADLPVQAPTRYELVLQPEDRQGARPRCSGDAAGARRRGDRVMKRRQLGRLRTLTRRCPRPVDARPVAGCRGPLASDAEVDAFWKRRGGV